MNINPIETTYRGYRFRSRLEARWAVFFDAMNLKYHYEPEGFNLNGTPYLPDFYLPEWDCWVEIKPEILKMREDNSSQPINYQECKLCEYLAEATGKVVLLMAGHPWGQVITEYEYPYFLANYGIAVFSPDMLVRGFYDGRGGVQLKFPIYIEFPELSPLTEEHYSLSDSFYGYMADVYLEFPQLFSSPLPQRGDAKELIKAHKIYYRTMNGKFPPRWYYGIADWYFCFTTRPRCGLRGIYHQSNTHIFCDHGNSWDLPSPELKAAYTAAQQARFEHGEMPILPQKIQTGG